MGEVLQQQVFIESLIYAGICPRFWVQQQTNGLGLCSHIVYIQTYDFTKIGNLVLHSTSCGYFVK